jgi:Predicted N-acetylglucosaminyl transferase
MAEIKTEAQSQSPTGGAPRTQVDFSEVQTQSRSWLQDNQMLLVGIVGALILIAALIFVYRKFIQEPKQAEAASMMWRAQQMFEADSFQVALAGRGASMMGFLDIADSYSGTPSGNLAKYYAGVSYLQLGQYQAAIDNLEAFSADGELLPASKAGALGDAYAQLGDLAKAEGFYKQAVSEAGDNVLLAPYYLKKMGMFHEHQGNPTAANELYTRIRTEFPQSAEADDIEKYILKTATK